jgi:RNA polymerase sigma factor (sigma-70 family)
MRYCLPIVFLSLCFTACADRVLADDIVIPHGQTEPPGPPLSPQEALEKMTVPEGFTVELVASEPDIVNPVAMTFDEQGRIWIIESIEYPRMSAGEGEDRIKVLEDTNGDGKADSITVFADGLNIPSGIAVGYGGVWVSNFLEHLPDAATAGPWLFRVATNLAKDASRTNTRRRSLVMQGRAMMSHSDPPPSPDSLATRTRARSLVHEAFDALSEKERMALLMREEGYAQREIAQALGTTTGSVGTLIARALRKAAARLREVQEEA